MLINRLVLENFKAFGSRQEIRLAPITLIFGANSAGKSSILQSLLLLKQTLNETAASDLVLLTKGELVDLGSFREMIFNHDTSRVCEITPMISPKYLDSPTMMLFDDDLAPIVRSQNIGIGVRFRQGDGGKPVEVADLPHYFGNSDTPAFVMEEVRVQNPEIDAFLGRRTNSRYGPNARPKYASVTRIETNHPLWQTLLTKYQPAYARRAKELASQYRKWSKANEEGEQQAKEVFRRMLSSSAFAYRTFHDIDELADNLMNKYSVEQVANVINEVAHDAENYSLEDFVNDLHMINRNHAVGLRHFLPLDMIPIGIEDIESWTLEDTVRRVVAADISRSYRGTPPTVELSSALTWSLREVLDRLVYIGPLREYPERHHIFSGTVASAVGKSGRFLPDLLYNRNSLVEATNQMLETFEIGYRLQVHRVDDPNIEDVFGLRMVDKHTNTVVSLIDVGFGLSQVLPVIVQSMLSFQNLVLIEQPEIHLHPKLQANLGSLFARSIQEPFSNQFILETHSEHLILRLQRLVREGELMPEDISVIYVTREEEGSVCHHLRMDATGGFIDEWPEGFFEEGFAEMFG